MGELIVGVVVGPAVFGWIEPTEAIQLLAEMASVVASLALTQGAIDQEVFTILIFAAFLLNLLIPLALKGCAVLLSGQITWREDTSRDVVQIDRFSTPLVEEDLSGRLLHALPETEDAGVVYGYGPEVEILLGELDNHDLPVVVNYGFHGHQNRLSVEHRTLGHAFQDAGYRTAYFGKCHFGIPLGGMGFDVAADYDRMRVKDEEARNWASPTCRGA